MAGIMNDSLWPASEWVSFVFKRPSCQVRQPSTQFSCHKCWIFTPQALIITIIICCTFIWLAMRRRRAAFVYSTKTWLFIEILILGFYDLQWVLFFLTFSPFLSIIFMVQWVLCPLFIAFNFCEIPNKFVIQKKKKKFTN